MISHGGRGIKQHSQQVVLDIADVAAGLVHTLDGVLNMAAVQRADQSLLHASIHLGCNILLIEFFLGILELYFHNMLHILPNTDLQASPGFLLLHSPVG